MKKKMLLAAGILAIGMVIPVSAAGNFNFNFTVSGGSQAGGSETKQNSVVTVTPNSSSSITSNKYITAWVTRGGERVTNYMTLNVAGASRSSSYTKGVSGTVTLMGTATNPGIHASGTWNP